MLAGNLPANCIGARPGQLRGWSHMTATTSTIATASTTGTTSTTRTTSSWSRVCVAGVSYVQFTSGASVEWTPAGKVKTCSEAGK